MVLLRATKHVQCLINSSKFDVESRTCIWQVIDVDMFLRKESIETLRHLGH